MPDTFLLTEAIVCSLVTAVCGISCSAVQFSIFLSLFSWKNCCSKDRLCQRRGRKWYNTQFALQKLITLLCSVYSITLTTIYCLLPILPQPRSFENDLFSFWGIFVLTRIILVFFTFLLFLLLSLWFSRVYFRKKVFERSKTPERSSSSSVVYKVIFDNIIAFSLIVYVILLTVLLVSSMVFIELVQDIFRFLLINELVGHVIGMILLVLSSVIVLITLYGKTKARQIDHQKTLITISRFRIILPFIILVFLGLTIIFILWTSQVPYIKCLRIHIPFQYNDDVCLEHEDEAEKNFVTIETVFWVLFFHVFPTFLITIGFRKISKREEKGKLILRRVRETDKTANVTLSLDDSLNMSLPGIEKSFVGNLPEEMPPEQRRENVNENESFASSVNNDSFYAGVTGDISMISLDNSSLNVSRIENPNLEEKSEDLVMSEKERRETESLLDVSIISSDDQDVTNDLSMLSLHQLDDSDKRSLEKVLDNI